MPEPHRDAAQSRRLLLFAAAFVTVGTVTSLVYHYVQAIYRGAPYPYDTFLCPPYDRFNDFFNVYRQAREFRPGQSDALVYSPLLHMVMTALNVVPAWLAFGVSVIAFLAALLAVLWWMTRVLDDRFVRVQQVVALSLLSYPVLLLLDRGNLEMLVFVLLAAFFYLYYWRRSPWAWMPLGLAIAAKYYWVVLLVLLISDRRYRQALLAACSAIAATVVSAVCVALVSGYSVLQVFGAMRSTLGGHMKLAENSDVANHAHGLWAAILYLNIVAGWTPNREREAFTAIAVVLFVYIAYMVVSQPLDGWRKATALVIAALLLPYENHDYTLIQLYFPLAMFIAAAPKGRTAWTMTALFAVLLVPVDYSYQHADIGVSALIYALALSALAVMALKEGPAATARSQAAEAEGPGSLALEGTEGGR